MPSDDFKARDGMKRLRKDENGVVSFEYIIIVTLIIAAVGVGFRTGALSMTTALEGGFGDMAAAFSAAL